MASFFRLITRLEWSVTNNKIFTQDSSMIGMEVNRALRIFFTSLYKQISCRASSSMRSSIIYHSKLILVNWIYINLSAAAVIHGIYYLKSPTVFLVIFTPQSTSQYLFIYLYHTWMSHLDFYKTIKTFFLDIGEFRDLKNLLQDFRLKNILKF